MNRLVVKAHRPLRLAALVAIAGILVALITWFTLDRSFWSLITSQLQEGLDQKRLWQHRRQLEKENTELRERVLMLERTTDLDKQTARLLQDEIRGLQEQIFKLKSDLEFYHGIMDFRGEDRGLDIHGITISELAQGEGYRLKVIVTNVSERERIVEGLLGITLEGIDDGKVRYLEIQDVAMVKPVDLGYKFENFYRFESALVLPESFMPQRVLVRLQPKNQKESKITKTFDWKISVGQ